ncbi:hypothetical protein SPRG_03761 [Saprolegnia parasitica CBS 223.65]|uniref:RING-type domain-containing protein n=1 Tax=Saprolegnia parasitica (strain CBS 223.65) TaxID=695850 RepID=A0A067CZ99_SAPPC|nr:hypothetical protein SPRG_03761 [Saprolegnia parasitica CBS 223.65]KDO31841.1 hypothetical protein SPRG_03761 [Saprolegnia parasitica CBS 223.65]|eukprot:XP_012197720.1 hypothetical protein SPRG_03761 [Saprolegnia parasitica CBS 223.65]
MSSEGECSICLEPLVDDLSCLPCGHVYHGKCVAMSLRAKRQCPTCRAPCQPHHTTKLFYTPPTAPCARPSNDAVDNEGTINVREIQVINKSLASRVGALEARLKSQTQDMATYEQRVLDATSEITTLKKANEVLKKAKHDAKYAQLKLQQDAVDMRATLKQLQAQVSAASVAASIQKFIDGNQISVLEAELQRPHDVILALKTSNRYRAEQYEKLTAKVRALERAAKRPAAPSSPERAPKRPRKPESKKPAPVVDLTAIDVLSPLPKSRPTTTEPPVPLFCQTIRFAPDRWRK